MALIQWKDEFSVNVAELDDQHRHLMQMINDLHDAMADDTTKHVLVKILVRMTKYTETHFIAEEEYQARIGYPEVATHIEEHRNFVNKLHDFEQDFINGNITLSDEVMIFLKDWLTNHILTSDKKYCSFFNEQKPT